jgi:shikimate dehydrogenase
VGVIGDPVSHSLSPTLHNAAFDACGLDWVYLAFPVERGRGGAAVAAARDLGLVGLNVTMPHKADAAAACDDLSPDAATLGSANTIVVGDDGRTSGHSTDGEGFLAALAEEGIEVAGRRVLVVGAGGAARAVVLALGRAGCEEVVVASRRAEAASRAAALAGGRAISFDKLASVAVAAGVVVNATPIGMAGEMLPVEVNWLRPGTVVSDLIYHPLETPFLAAARRRGLTATNGLGMLVHQAASAFRLWTGVDAPVGVMRAAAEEVVAGR